MTAETTTPEELLQQSPETSDINAGNQEVATDLNNLVTSINLNELAEQVVTTKEWVSQKVDADLNGASFYNIEGDKLNLNVDEVIKYLTEMNKDTWNEFKENVSDNNYYTLVLGIQVLLVALGNKDLKIDGIYGPHTKEAVITFQQRYNESNNETPISVDGIIGPETIRSIIAEIQLRKGNASNEVVDNKSNNEVTDEQKQDIENTKADIDKYVSIDGGNITINNPKIVIGGVEYNEIEQGASGKGYKIIEGNLYIGEFDAEGKVNGPTIIVDKDGNISKGEIKDGKQIGFWIQINIINLIIKRIDYPDKSDDILDESVEQLEEGTYGKFEYKDIVNCRNINFHDKLVEDKDEIVLDSIDDLRLFTDDTNLLQKYNEEYFRNKSLAIKYFIISSGYYEPIKAEKKGNDIVVTYNHVPHEREMGLESGECLYVECDKPGLEEPDKIGKVEWKDQSENDNILNDEVTDEQKQDIENTKKDIDEYVSIVDGNITIDKQPIVIGGVEYTEITEKTPGKGYKIIDGNLYIGDFDAEGNTNGTTIIVDKDGNISKGETKDGKQIGIWIQIDVNLTIVCIDYANDEEIDELKISDTETIDNIDTKVKDLRKKLNELGEWNDDGGFDFTEGVKNDANVVTFDGVEYQEWTEAVEGKSYKVEDGKLIIGNFKEGKLDGVAIEYNKDESFYYGEFKDGGRDGIGIESKNGSVYVCLYQNGELYVKEDINTTDKEIASRVDIINSDADGLSNLIEKQQEKEYDLDAIKADLYEIKGKVEEIIILGGESGRAFKDGIERDVDGGGSQITFGGQTYTKVESLDDLDDGCYYCINEEGKLFMCKFENGHSVGDTIIVDRSGGIHKYHCETGSSAGTDTFLRLNGDILVDEYENDVRISRKKLLSGDIEKMKSIREQLSSIITINENKEFNVLTQEVILNGITYQNIPAESLSQYTGDGYILSHDEENNQYYYQFGHFENGKLEGEAIFFYNNGSIHLGNFHDGEELNGMRCDTEGNVYDYTVEEGEITETPKELDNIDDIPYSERMKKFAEEKEKLTELKSTLDQFIYFDGDGKVMFKEDDDGNKRDEIKIGDQTYVNGDADDFQGGFCYKISNYENSERQYINLGNYDKDNNKWIDGDLYLMNDFEICVYNRVNGYRKNYSYLNNDGSQGLLDYDDEGWTLQRQELSTDGSISITKYNTNGNYEYVKKIENPNKNGIDEHINKVYGLLSSAVEYDDANSKFEFKDGVLGEGEVLELGGNKYIKLPETVEDTENTIKAYTFAEFEGKHAFIVGDFKAGKLDGTAMIYLEGGVTLSGEFKDGKPDGLFIKRLPEGVTYVYKYDSGSEICYEKASDEDYGEVNQEYLNGKIGRFLENPENLTQG